MIFFHNKKRAFALLLLFVVTAAAGITVRKGILLRREEFINGEADLFEKITGIVGSRRGNTFLFGNAEVVSGNKKLNITFKLDDREQAERNVNPALLVAAAYKAVVKHTAHVIVVVLAAALAKLGYLCAEAYRVNDFCR